jgi:hypothetical protein
MTYPRLRYRLVIELDYLPRTDFRKKTVKRNVVEALGYWNATRYRRVKVMDYSHVVGAAVRLGRVKEVDFLSSSGRSKLNNRNPGGQA